MSAAVEDAEVGVNDAVASATGAAVPPQEPRKVGRPFEKGNRAYADAIEARAEDAKAAVAVAPEGIPPVLVAMRWVSAGGVARNMMEKRLAEVRDKTPVKFMHEEAALEKAVLASRPVKVAGEDDPAEPVEDLIGRLRSELQ